MAQYSVIASTKMTLTQVLDTQLDRSISSIWRSWSVQTIWILLCWDQVTFLVFSEQTQLDAERKAYNTAWWNWTFTFQSQMKYEWLNKMVPITMLTEGYGYEKEVFVNQWPIQKDFCEMIFFKVWWISIIMIILF